jgi:hypothetical protein
MNILRLLKVVLRFLHCFNYISFYLSLRSTWLLGKLLLLLASRQMNYSPLYLFRIIAVRASRFWIRDVVGIFVILLILDNHSLRKDELVAVIYCRWEVKLLWNVLKHHISSYFQLPKPVCGRL